jgi:hypothetical protein
MSIRARCVLLTATLLLSGASTVTVAPAAAQAPTVTTQPATAIDATTARLVGRVDPNGATTTYNFQYGRTRALGTSTALAPAGRGNRAITVRADVGGLRPNTQYFFRIVASNASGVSSGQTRSFRTRREPLALAIVATPNPVTIGAPTTITGVLTGTGSGSRAIQLQQNAFPFTSGFVNSGNPVLTAPDGTFTVPVLGLAVNTQFRVVVVNAPARASAPLLVGARPVVATDVTTRRPRRGQLVRVAGTVRPSWVPAEVAVQRRSADGRWITVAGTVTRSYRSDRSRYAKRLRINRSGTYRIFVGLRDSRYAPATGRVMSLRVR